jgi:hypothetical protein
VNQRLAEFDAGDILCFQPFTRGLMRIIYGVICEWQEDGAADKRWPTARSDLLRLLTVDSEPESEERPAAKKPVTVAPGPKTTKHQWPARQRRAVPGTASGRGRQLESEPITLPQLVAELQKMAMGGKMPAMTQWDESKPATWPGSHAVIGRFGKGWAAIAEEAGLTLKRQAGREASSNGVGDFH